MRQMRFPDLYDASVYLCYPGLCPFYLCSCALFILVHLYYMRLFVFTYRTIAGRIDIRLERELTICESDRCLVLGFNSLAMCEYHYRTPSVAVATTY